MKMISGSVGEKCLNKPKDVSVVKILLRIASIHHSNWSFDPGGITGPRISGSIDAQTIKAIKAFQKSKVNTNGGIIEPNSKTMKKLKAIAKSAAISFKSKKPPVLITRSLRRPGKKRDGTIANDMKYGDYTAKKIKNIRWNFVVDDVMVDIDTVKHGLLFREFRDMATELFAIGDLDDNINKMIDKFEANTGGTYSIQALTRVADKHHKTKAFVNEMRKKLEKVIIKYNGDIRKVRPLIDIPPQSMVHRIKFATVRDIFSGVTIATNDIWAWTVEVTEYLFDGINYSGEFKLTLFDHFGLDEPDVDYSKSFGNLAGFRAWFILQHLDRFGFKPFITIIELEKNFSGSLR